MLFLRQQTLNALLAIHFAIVGCGSVVLHQLAGDTDCQCLNHGRSSEIIESDETDCDCLEHREFDVDSKPAVAANETQLDDHACPLCQFFEQRMPVASCMELAHFDKQIELVEAAPSANHWSNAFDIPSARGPPVIL